MKAMTAWQTETAAIPVKPLKETAEAQKGAQKRAVSELKDAAEAVWVELRGLQAACRRYC